jgi:hypothetical protein
MGYWISKGGDIYPNADHFEFVKAHPKLFGLTPDAVKRLGLGDRQPTIDEAISKDWIRVRGGGRQGLAFEIAVLSQNTLFNIREFLIAQKVDPSQKVLIDEVATGATWYNPVSWITSDEALAVARNPRKRRRLALRP